MRLVTALLVLCAAAQAVAGAALEPAVAPQPGTPTFTPLGDQSDDVPMFLLLTHDDHIWQKTYDVMTAVTNGRKSLGGCPMVATMFTIASNVTDCKLLLDLHQRGYEIADHTVTHVSVLTLDKAKIEWELATARRKLAECGIPESHIQGVRAPYLENKIELRQVAAEQGFLYDSTMIEQMRGDSYSRHFGQRIWPWDMVHGIPINCGWFQITKCDPSKERYPGLWEVPIWDLKETGVEYSMDYGEECTGEDCVYDILVANFNAAYRGNRAPMPLFIHTPYLANGTRVKQYQKFLDYALKLPDVWPVTMQQLIAWMKNPIPASELTPEKLGCGNPGGLGPYGAADSRGSASGSASDVSSDASSSDASSSEEEWAPEEEQPKKNKGGRKWRQEEEW